MFAANISWTPVHPRACGEHAAGQLVAEVVDGSSPRLRGTPLAFRVQVLPARFIPAPAGNTAGAAPGPGAMAVHPRACGEHSAPEQAEQRQVGSSPRLRGTRPIANSIISASRFIPAPAGNTASLGMRQRHQAVHPRACGEHGLKVPTLPMADGSSPRLRGTLRLAKPAAGFVRFIPAPAGNTITSPSSSSMPSVHPRACGEHRKRVASAFCRRGSSPRLRGTPTSHLAYQLSCWFIPAPAGNTPIVSV